MRQLLTFERHAQPRVGEPDAAVRFADDIIGTIDPLALVAVHDDLALAVVGPAGNPAVAALADHQPALQIKGRAVAFAGSGAHGFRRLAEPQPVEHAAADIGEIIISVGMPQRAFGKDKPGRRTFCRCRFQDRIEPGHPCPSIKCVYARLLPARGRVHSGPALPAVEENSRENRIGARRVTENVRLIRYLEQKADAFWTPSEGALTMFVTPDAPAAAGGMLPSLAQTIGFDLDDMMAT